MKINIADQPFSRYHHSATIAPKKHPRQPNPFARKTVISFELAIASALDLRIYSNLGQEVFHGVQILEEPVS